MTSTKKTSASHHKSVRSAEAGRFVQQSGDVWVVGTGVGSRASSIHPTQGEAIKAAREAVGAKGGQLVIHGADGRIRSSFTVGRDPFCRISAVEGIAPTGAAKTRAKQFTRSKLSSEQRLQAIIDAHRPTKG